MTFLFATHDFNLKERYTLKNSQAKDLFQLQTELIDMKVAMVVSKAIDRAITQLSDLLHNEIQGMRNEMNVRFSSIEDRLLSIDTHLSFIDHRLVAVEAKLKNVTHTEIRTRFLDYTCNATLAIIGGAVMYAMISLPALIK